MMMLMKFHMFILTGEGNLKHRHWIFQEKYWNKLLIDYTLGHLVLVRKYFNRCTEIVINDNLFRSHYCYSKEGSWYDWVYFRWHGFEQLISAKIRKSNDDHRSIRMCYYTSYGPRPRHSTRWCLSKNYSTFDKEKWIVLLAAELSLTDTYFDSKTLKRIKLHSDKDIWIAPLSTLVGSWFVVYNKNYSDSNNKII